MPYEQLDTEHVKVFPVAERKSKAAIDEIVIDPDAPVDAGDLADELDNLAARMRAARDAGRSRMLAYGAHLVKNGAQPVVIRLMEQGWITHLATNGAGGIHDLEFSFNRLSTESVRDNVATGTFGTWDETGRFTHLAVLAGAVQGRGYGESIGKLIANEGVDLTDPAELEAEIRSEPGHELSAARADLLHTMSKWGLNPGRHELPCPYAAQSILGQAYKLGVPATIHPGIGYDIIYTHPMAGGAAIGRAAYTDFRVFAGGVKNLTDGVFLSVGSAIMAPQVYEKSQSVANNRLLAEGDKVTGHTIAVVDIADGGGWDWNAGEPPIDNPAYYLRFCKSFARMGADMRYLQMDNRSFLQSLWQRLR